MLMKSKKAPMSVPPPPLEGATCAAFGALAGAGGVAVKCFVGAGIGVVIVVDIIEE